MFNAEKELEDLINQWTPMLDKGLKTQKGLLEIALVPFDTIFEKDVNGNPIYKHLDKPQTKELIGALGDVISMYKESKYTEGIKKGNKIMKLLEKNLEN
tara:strand:+ start:530 stop:826 length:297 start_codon:yes stop_codon:yes gene_type:complete